MKYPYQKVTRLFFFVLGLAFASASWSADTPPPADTQSAEGCSTCDVVSAVNTVNSTLVSGLGTTKDSTGNVNPWLSQIFTALAGVNANITYQSAVAVATALYTIQSNHWVSQDAKTDTQRNTATLLVQTVNQQAENATNFAKCVPVPGASSTSCNLPGTKQTNTNEVFSISSLLDTQGMDKTSTEYNQALQFIQILSGQGSQLLNLSAALASIPPGKNPKVDTFRASLGTYLAHNSVGLNVLYRLLAERTIQKGLGTTAKMPTADASPLQVEAYGAGLPMTADWVKNNVVNASISDVEKQQLLVLVGIQNELFNIRMQLETLNATTAATQLETLHSINKNTLEELRIKAAQ